MNLRSQAFRLNIRSKGYRITYAIAGPAKLIPIEIRTGATVNGPTNRRRSPTRPEAPTRISNNEAIIRPPLPRNPRTVTAGYLTSGHLSRRGKTSGP